MQFSKSLASALSPAALNLSALSAISLMDREKSSLGGSTRECPLVCVWYLGRMCRAWGLPLLVSDKITLQWKQKCFPFGPVSPAHLATHSQSPPPVNLQCWNIGAPAESKQIQNLQTYNQDNHYRQG